jgi:hypothetical protein
MDKMSKMTSDPLPVNGAAVAAATAQEFELESSPRQDENLEDMPPDGGYGWICVGACFLINCFTWGTVSVSSGWTLLR